MTRVTHHAAQRGKERLGLKWRAMVRLAPRALERGRPPSDFAGAFRRYLDGHSLQPDTRVRVHGEFLWIFSASAPVRVITVMQIPSKFRALLRRLRAQEATAMPHDVTTERKEFELDDEDFAVILAAGAGSRDRRRAAVVAAGAREHRLAAALAPAGLRRRDRRAGAREE